MIVKSRFLIGGRNVDGMVYSIRGACRRFIDFTLYTVDDWQKSALEQTAHGLIIIDRKHSLDWFQEKLISKATPYGVAFLVVFGWTI